jgi:hypothetical protein
MHAPSLSQIFNTPDDPRIRFFTNELSQDDLGILLLLRQKLFKETSFKNHKILKGTTTLYLRNDEAGKPDSKVEVIDALFEIIGDNVPEKITDYPARLAEQERYLKKCRYRDNICLIIGLGMLLGVIGLIYNVYLDDKAKGEKAMADGTCIWVEKSCLHTSGKGSLRGYIDCYQPEELCDFGFFNTACKMYIENLEISCVLMMLFTLLIVPSESPLCKFTLEEIYYSPDYDAQLNNLCKKNGLELDKHWSDIVHVKEMSFTVRGLTLMILFSFDDHFYKQLFSSILPKIIKGSRVFESLSELNLTDIVEPAPAVAGTVFREASLTHRRPAEVETHGPKG